MAHNLRADVEEAVVANPIFYLSLHGSYPLGNYLTPHEEKVDGKEPLMITVPEDVLVIETGDIGWFCYFTNFIKVIKDLLVDRERLYQYMTGHPPESDTDEQRFLRSRAVQSCHIYLPGATIANRFLKQEVGRRDSEGARCSEYGKEMRFFRYDVGRPRVELFESIRKRLIEEYHGEHSAYTTYENMFKEVQRQPVDGLKVVFFPVCGEVQASVAGQPIGKEADVIGSIVKKQRKADAAWTKFIGGQSLKRVYEGMNRRYRGPKTVCKGAQFVGRAPYYKGPGEVIPSGAVYPLSNRVTRSSMGSKGGRTHNHIKTNMKSCTKKRLNQHRYQTRLKRKLATHRNTAINKRVAVK